MKRAMVKLNKSKSTFWKEKTGKRVKQVARFRKILPIILMIWPYVFFVHEYFEYKNAHNFFTLYVILTIVVYVLNIVNALTYPKDKVNDLAFYDMLIKFDVRHQRRCQIGTKRQA